MLTLTQIKKAIKKGYLDEAYKEVRLYGTINWEQEFLHHGKESVTLEIEHKKTSFEFTLRLGEVVEVHY